MKNKNELFTIMPEGKAVANIFGIGVNNLIARSMGMNNETTAKKASSFRFYKIFNIESNFYFSDIFKRIFG